MAYSHFTVPRWVAALGGWENPETVDRFARFAEFATRRIGDLTGAACTFNEPNVALLLGWRPAFLPRQAFADMSTRAARATGSERFSSSFSADPGPATANNMLTAHLRAFDALKSGPWKFPVGATLAIADD